MKEDHVKNLRTVIFILSACLMMVYNLSCAHVSVGTNAGMGLGYEQDNEPTAPDDSLEPITLNSTKNDVKLSSHKIIVQPVSRRIAEEK